MNGLKLLVRGCLYLIAGLGFIATIPVAIAGGLFFLPFAFIMEGCLAAEWAFLGDERRFRTEYDSYGVQVAKWAYNIPTMDDWLIEERKRWEAQPDIP